MSFSLLQMNLESFSDYTCLTIIAFISEAKVEDYWRLNLPKLPNDNLIFTVGWGRNYAILKYSLSSVFLELYNFSSEMAFKELFRSLHFSLLIRKQRPREAVWIDLGHKSVMRDAEMRTKMRHLTLHYVKEEIKSGRDKYTRDTETNRIQVQKMEATKENRGEKQ